MCRGGLMYVVALYPFMRWRTPDSGGIYSEEGA